MKRLCILLWLLVSHTATVAQNYFGLLNSPNQVISAGLSANPHLNANADYMYLPENSGSPVERYGILLQANLPLFSQEGFDYDIRLGAGALIKLSGQYKTIAGVTWNFSRTEDIAGRFFHSGFKIDLFPGYYMANWVFAPHLALDYQPWIHIRHKQYATDAFADLYSDSNGKYRSPKSGWFYQSNLNMMTGLAVAYYQPHWHVALSGGFQHRPNETGLVALPDIGIMPFYSKLNFGYALDR